MTDSNETNHDPPHDREAERAVLGAMLIDTDVIPRVMPILGETPDAFFTTDHQIIYSAVVDIYDRHSKADILLVADHLKNTEQLKRVGGAIYLYDLQARIVETENTEFHAQIVRDKWIRRRQLKFFSDGKDIVHRNHDADIFTLQEQIDQAYYKLTDTYAAHDSEPIGNIINLTLKEIEARYKNPQPTAGIPTGFTDFDIVTNGLQPGNFIIIAGRPGMGKTSFVLNIAQNIAFDHEQSTALFSLEMTKSELTTRILASEATLAFQDLRSGRIKEHEWPSLTDSARRIINGGHRIIINDTRTLTIGGLKIEARRIKNRYDNLALVIVDYLQLLHTDRDYQNRVLEIADISRELKSLAWELDIPVIACSQLNRESEKSRTKPGLANLRDSGALEQDADIAAFLHAESDSSNQSPEIRQLLILKNRNGKTSDIDLQFHPETMTFSNPNVEVTHAQSGHSLPDSAR